jgi:hypothetical protein
MRQLLKESNTGRIAVCKTVRHDHRIGMLASVHCNDAYLTNNATCSGSLLNVRYNNLKCYRRLRPRGLSNAEIIIQESSSLNASENALCRT